MTTEPAASMTDKRIYLIKQTERKKTQTGRFGYSPAPGVLSAAIKVNPAYQVTPQSCNTSPGGILRTYDTIDVLEVSGHRGRRICNVISGIIHCPKRNGNDTCGESR